MPKRVIILGSTGSIGRSSLDVIGSLPEDLSIVGLSAGQGWEALGQQVLRHRPPVVTLADEVAAGRLRAFLKEKRIDTDVLCGPDAVERMVETAECDFVLSAIVGIAGLPATLAAVRKGLSVGLANKESLVVTGSLMVEAAKASGATLIPVDSEHSAIFQSLHAGRHEEIERLFLTASGGPFRTWTAERMRTAKAEDAMRHPTWSMGPKITIDSATMMNKALEIIEAKWLFSVDADRIEVVIHPESIIHSMVAFRDGSVVAQMGRPDMRTPIQYAMTYPHRLDGQCERLDFSKLGRMHFEPPDAERFPALRLGRKVAELSGTAGAAFNAANEAAVELFRAGRIGFLDIASLVESALERHTYDPRPDLGMLMAVDRWARNEVSQCCPV